jgi:hypothetical protein
MSHILRYIFVIAVAYDGRRVSPRPQLAIIALAVLREWRGADGYWV